MPSYYGPSNGAGQLRLDVSWTQDIAGNFTDVYASLHYVGQWVSSSNSTVGLVISSNQIALFTADLSLPTGTTLLTYGSLRHHHNADGTKVASAQGGLNLPFVGWALNVDSGLFSLPTIPRIPSAPTTPTADTYSTASMRLRFSAQGTVGATQYQLQRATNAAFTAGVTTVASNGTTTASGLTPGTAYYFRARSGNAQGWSPWSGVRTAYTLPQAKAPTLDSIGPTGMRAVVAMNGGTAGSLTRQVQYANNSSFTGATAVASTGTTVITGLQPGTQYWVRARGSNVSGTGPWSAATTATTATLNPPTITPVSSTMGTSSTVTITPPSGAAFTSYVVEAEYLTPLPKPPGSDKSATTTGTSVTVTGLIPGATYRWRARGIVGTYSSEWSGWVSAAQLNPGTLDKLYFDALTTAPDSSTRYVVGTSSVQVEEVIAPKYWATWTNTGGAGAPKSSIRRTPGNLVPSEGSLYRAQVKLDTPVTSGNIFILLEGDAPPSNVIEVLPAASYSIRLTVRASRPISVRPTVLPQGAISGVSGDTVELEANEVREFAMVYRTKDTETGLKFGVAISQGEAGTLIDADGGLLALGRPESYFDGGTADTYRYLHEWEGAEWDSVSLRYTLPNAIEPDPFLDPNCPPPPSPPRPPVPVNECIPEVDTWRRYYSPLPSVVISSALTSLPIFTITTGEQSEGPVRLTIFENPDNLGSDVFVPGVPVFEQVISFIPANAVAVLDSVSERAYGQSLSSDLTSDIGHMVFASDGGPADWPELSCGRNYMLALDVPSSSPLGNVTLSASLTNRMG